jgi:hypothetical protein
MDVGKSFVGSIIAALVVGAVVVAANFSGATATLAGLATLVIVAGALMKAF